MHVLFATMQFGRGYGQGAERYLRLLAEGLSALGHQATVLAGDPEQRGASLPLGAPVEGRPRTLAYPSQGWMAIQGLPPATLVPLLRELRPDLVHVVNPGHIGLGLLEAGQVAGIPVVVTVVDFWWLCPKHTLWHSSGRNCTGDVSWRECLACIAAEREQSWRQVLARLPGVRTTVLPVLYQARWASRGVRADERRRWRRRREWVLGELNRAAAVIVLSRTAEQVLGPALRGPRVARITNGLEPHWFEPTNEARPAVATGEGGTTIGFAGALAPHKGPHVLLEAARRLDWPRLKLRLAGRFSDAIYEQALRRLGDRRSVDFVGALPARQMPEFLRRLDVLVVPSLWLENVPMIVLEAQACGTPVLVSDVGGIREIVKDPMARFRAGSAEDLARCLEAWRASGGASVRPRVPTVDEMVAHTLAVYQEVVAASASGSESRAVRSSPRG